MDKWDGIKAAMIKGLNEGRALRAACEKGTISEGAAVAAVCARPDGGGKRDQFRVIHGGKASR